MDYYSAIKEWNHAIFNNMDGPRDDYTKRSKSEEDKYHAKSKKKNDTNELIKSETDLQR